jgi:hypothetical protein
MERVPVTAERRRRFEEWIRVLDLVAYGGVALCGGFALGFPPASVVDELRSAPWLLGVWGVLLLAGGVVGFLGRLTRFWMVETPATVSAFGGAIIYLFMLGRFATTSITAMVATLLVGVAALLLARRWLELQIFGYEPGLDFQARLRAAAGRRTTNMVHRHR